MKILIVEDDSFKLDAIRRILAERPGVEIETAVSLRDAMTTLEASEFDFVVLDMAIPSHTSAVPAVDTYSQPVGGLDILMFLAMGGRTERVAVLTQHPTVEYDRRHVPLHKIVEALRADGIYNVVEAILFTEERKWEEPLLTAIGR